MLFKNQLVQNEIDAYLLGFLYADGFITSKYKEIYRAVGITLSSKDKEFLDQIAQYFDVLPIVKKQGKYEIVKLYKYDPILVRALIKFGFSGSKTYDQIDILQHVPHLLVPHFIRGFFDGDGSIFKTKKNTYGVGFVGMNAILFDQICIILTQLLGRPVKKFLEKNKYYRIRLAGNPTLIKIREYLYRGATIFLARKKQKFDTLQIYNGKNGMEGLHFYKPNQKWGIKIGKKFLGLYLTKEEAMSKLTEYKNEYCNT